MTLLERDPHAPPIWQGSVPITNRYTFGLAGERFFQAIKEQGRILGTHCTNCMHTYVPAATFCERCLNQLDDWIDVGTVGEIVTYTLLSVNFDGSPKTSPELVAFIRLGDGGLIHRIAEVNSEPVFIGMQVEAVFRPPAERQGSILDIAYFKPYP
ncbi:MAG: hypothetical protein A2Z45_04555 [Chloroflexi bacterium RBG_19FT_COMBO_55_16]|nr:MAG: hypothetical protein A2Z45_04555 [Chloroflexi bacterium RBG_19FT_COMBO_55_16]